MGDVAVDAPVEEDEVEVVEAGRVGLLLEQPDLAAGVAVAQPLHDLREDHVRHALERAEVDAPVTGLEPVDGGGEARRLRQQVAPVREHHRAEGRDAHPFRPAGPVEDRAADGLLQRGDLLADRRLGVAEAERRPSERTLVGYRGEGGEVPQFDVGHGGILLAYTINTSGENRFS